MSQQSAIKIEEVYKKYCKSLKRSMLYGMSDILRNSVGLSSHAGRLRPNEFWAVEDVCVDIKPGESFGLIGPNGSGKTTLLKMLNGIFWPDRGRIAINGRVGALIAVGAGFHPMLTGRENIYINGAILGMTKSEVDAKFDAIVSFADIGDFLDTAVKHYSSGMYVRLGFAIAVHCDPEILLVDEILAVGDREFQIKCYQKINQIRQQGTTVILVAHNEYTIREYTTRCLYLNHGKVRFLGPSEEGISQYIKDTLEHRSQQTSVKEDRNSSASKKAELLPPRFFNANGEEVNSIASGEELIIEFNCIIHQKLTNPVFGINFYDNAGFMYCVNSEYEQQRFDSNLTGRITLRIKVPNFHLPSNNYLCSTIIAEDNPDNLMDWHNMAYRFVVGRAQNARGSIKLPTQWSVTRGTP